MHLHGSSRHKAVLKGLIKTDSKNMWMWHLGIWFSSEHDGAGLIVELQDLGGFSQPELFCDSVMYHDHMHYMLMEAQVVLGRCHLLRLWAASAHAQPSWLQRARLYSAPRPSNRSRCAAWVRVRNGALPGRWEAAEGIALELSCFSDLVSFFSTELVQSLL